MCFYNYLKVSLVRLSKKIVIVLLLIHCCWPAPFLKSLLLSISSFPISFLHSYSFTMLFFLSFTSFLSIKFHINFYCFIFLIFLCLSMFFFSHQLIFIGLLYKTSIFQHFLLISCLLIYTTKVWGIFSGMIHFIYLLF